jgi:hypothetical protein
LGRGWSKQRLCERFGDFVPGPEVAEVTRNQVDAYVERPLGRVEDRGLWREYQGALDAARIQRQEVRDALSSKIGAARTAHRRRFKLRHHAIAAMPVAGTDKRKLYKMLALERKVAERKLGVKIKGWRAASIDAHPGSWKEFLAARASRGDQRAMRRIARQLRGPGIKSDDSHVRVLPSRGSRTSRGTIVHNLPGGVRLRESAGAIELLGDSCDEALEQLARLAEQRFGGRRVMLLGPMDIQGRLSEMVTKRGLELVEERQR